MGWAILSKAINPPWFLLLSFSPVSTLFHCSLKLKGFRKQNVFFEDSFPISCAKGLPSICFFFPKLDKRCRSPRRCRHYTRISSMDGKSWISQENVSAFLANRNCHIWLIPDGSLVLYFSKYKWLFFHNYNILCLLCKYQRM